MNSQTLTISKNLETLLRQALSEDIGTKDVSANLIPADNTAKAVVFFREDSMLCGLPVAERLLRIVDEDVRILPVAKDGEMAGIGRPIFYVEGKTRSILTAERTVLNFLSHMSAIADKTRTIVEKVKGSKVSILDTRKTTPLFRILDRYAVRVGGGTNHRLGLYDGVLIKENHLKALDKMRIETIVKTARSKYPKNMQIGVEVENLEQLQSALRAGCDYILLDNFNTDDVRQAVSMRNESGSETQLEVSGGITKKNVSDYALCGVERISIGSLTHSVKAVDISLKLI